MVTNSLSMTSSGVDSSRDSTCRSLSIMTTAWVDSSRVTNSLSMTSSGVYGSHVTSSLSMTSSGVDSSRATVVYQ